MKRIVGIGAIHEIEGFALAGVHVIAASTFPDVTAAWAGLDSDVGLVVLSPAAAEVLRDRLGSRRDLLTVVVQ